MNEKSSAIAAQAALPDLVTFIEGEGKVVAIVGGFEFSAPTKRDACKQLRPYLLRQIGRLHEFDTDADSEQQLKNILRAIEEPANPKAEELLRKCMESAVKLAFIRHDIEPEEDTATVDEIAEDAAGACFGEECCDDKPIPEVAELLRMFSAIEEGGCQKS